MRRLAIAVATTAVAAAAAAGTPGPATASMPQVVAAGLDNPRGIDVDANGFVYVAESGRGGGGPCIPGGEGQVCLGRTGAISRIVAGRRERVLDGLPSLAAPGTGAGAAGPSDVAVAPTGAGLIAMGLGADPRRRADLGAGGALLGRVLRFTASGGRGSGPTSLGDLAAHELAADPDAGDVAAGGPDSNPSSVLGTERGALAVDAGGNDLLSVSGAGAVSTRAVFGGRLVPAPPFLGLPAGATIPMQAVPTAVAQGPAGEVYVSQLTGFPFPVGGARISRVDPSGATTVVADGLTCVTDLLVARDGLYVVETASSGLLSDDPTGRVIRIAPDGVRRVIASEGLVQPYGIAAGPRGELYVTDHSSEAGTGRVLRLR